jgi:hypothetical protein
MDIKKLSISKDEIKQDTKLYFISLGWLDS